MDYESVAYPRKHIGCCKYNIIEDDFLKMNLPTPLTATFCTDTNYPYKHNFSNDSILQMLDNKELIPCRTGMIQKEVAERNAPPDREKTYGILSILIQAWYSCRINLFTVHEHVFSAPPKVNPAVIRLGETETKELGCGTRVVSFKQVVKNDF